MVKPHGHLVPVSSTPYGASTPGLSTSSSTRGLQGPRGPGMPYLGDGFPLICFQRLSCPHIATRRCGWRHNRITGGASIPVLSYYGQLPSSILRPPPIATELSHDHLYPARVAPSFSDSRTLWS